MKYSLILFLLLICSITFSQNRPVNGVNDFDQTIYAFKNARIHVSSENTILDGVLVIQNDKIIAVGPFLLTIIPKGAVIIDCKKRDIYPSFIEIFSDYGINKIVKKRSFGRQQLHSIKGEKYYWNQAVNSEFNAVDNFNSSFKEKKTLINTGFGVVNAHRKDGVTRGSSVTYLLDTKNKSEIISAKSSTFYSFKKGSSKQSYPSSQMGSIALLKQLFYDLEWYDNQKGLRQNLTLNAEIDDQKLPKIFSVDNKLEALRVHKLGREMGLDFIIKSGGNEYESIEEIKATGSKFIIPINFPSSFEVSDPYDSRFVSLEQLKEWNEAPSNPYFLFQHGIDYCFTSNGLKPKEYISNIRKAVKRGLPASEALKKVTQTPAEYLKINDHVGTLEKGKIANFIITERNYFTTDNAQILENWVAGNRHVINEVTDNELAGVYDLNLNGKIYAIDFKNKSNSYKAELTYFKSHVDSVNQKVLDTIKVTSKVDYNGKSMSFIFNIDDDHFNGIVSCNGSFYTNLGLAEGNANYNSAKWFKWSLIRSEKGKKVKRKKEFEVDSLVLTDVLRYPNLAYGFDTLPEQKSYFIKNATIWTNEDIHVLKNANLLIQNGKVKFLGNSTVGLPMNVVMIDAKGKYVTCGIVDEHSHIAISKGVNEGGQSNSAEVTIEDVVNPEDINIYRQLAGGVTTAQLLHGSANPIGGRSALIKLKWGFAAKDYLIDGADGFIKFALGENVKQSNSSPFNNVRFPQTRLGVEQVYVDAFTRAQEYEKKWGAFNKLPKKQQVIENQPRTDLELEVVLEILKGKRFVTCHSYIQSEINMLMHVADTFGFRMNTFTHILEGYKIADKMKAHGVGGSTFSDWWAYKYEVRDAIPYNAAIMTNQGIIVAINSDDAEMGRRLNQEAAKTVKYGGMTEQQAWKMVTLNPAKLLHLDDKIGSIKVGKDADIVIWSDNPLSINAIVEKTFVDGYLLFDSEKNEELKKKNSEERAVIIGKMLNKNKDKKNVPKPRRKHKVLYHCNTLEE